jgi:hypothetical protein
VVEIEVDKPLQGAAAKTVCIFLCFSFKHQLQRAQIYGVWRSSSCSSFVTKMAPKLLEDGTAVTYLRFMLMYCYYVLKC